MTLDLRPLRQLLALSEHGSFGRAAVALHITQPALSRSIKLLEEQVGAALFDRTATGVTPTDEGRVLIARARQLVAAADELDREVLRRRIPGAVQVVVGAGPYPAETIVPVALASFVAAHPLARVRVLIRGDWDELLRRLRARELDFVVAEISTLEGEHDLDVEALTPHRLYFVARHDHPLTRRATVLPEHTFNHPFLSISRAPPRLLQPMLARRPPPDPRQPDRPLPAIELGSLEAIKRVLVAGDAVTALTLACVADELERGTLALLCTEPWMSTRYGIVSLKGHALGAAAERLCGRLRDAEAALVAAEALLAARYQAAARQASEKPARRRAGR